MKSTSFEITKTHESRFRGFESDVHTHMKTYLSREICAAGGQLSSAGTRNDDNIVVVMSRGDHLPFRVRRQQGPAIRFCYIITTTITTTTTTTTTTITTATTVPVQ